jgi:nitrate/nitrite-specific signal transduction histidine kinase
MLKITEHDMEHENDKWLERHLKKTPQIDQNDDFVVKLQRKIEHRHSSDKKHRLFILTSTYLMSLLVLLWISPWQSLTSWSREAYSDVANLVTLASHAQMPTQLPLISFAVLFIIGVTVYLISQESFE